MFHMTQLGPGSGSSDHMTSSTLGNVDSMEYGFVVYDNPNHVTVSSSTSVYRRPRSKFCIGLIALAVVIVVISIALGFIIHYSVKKGVHVPAGSTSVDTSSEYVASEVQTVDFEGIIRITSLKWTNDLGNHAGELYRVVSKHIERELNQVFELGPLMERYNHTVVIDLSPGSVVVDFIILLNSRRGLTSDILTGMMLEGLGKRKRMIKKLKANDMPASKIVFDFKSLQIKDSHEEGTKIRTKYIPKSVTIPTEAVPTTTEQIALPSFTTETRPSTTVILPTSGTPPTLSTSSTTQNPTSATSPTTESTTTFSSTNRASFITNTAAPSATVVPTTVTSSSNTTTVDTNSTAFSSASTVSFFTASTARGSSASSTHIPISTTTPSGEEIPQTNLTPVEASITTSSVSQPIFVTTKVPETTSTVAITASFEESPFDTIPPIYPINQTHDHEGDHGNLNYDTEMSNVHHLNNESSLWVADDNTPVSLGNSSAFDGRLDVPDRITNLNDTDALETPVLNSFGATDFSADDPYPENITLKEENTFHFPDKEDFEDSDNVIPPHETYSSSSEDFEQQQHTGDYHSKHFEDFDGDADIGKAPEYNHVPGSQPKDHHGMNILDLGQDPEQDPDSYEDYDPHSSIELHSDDSNNHVNHDFVDGEDPHVEYSSHNQSYHSRSQEFRRFHYPETPFSMVFTTQTSILREEDGEMGSGEVADKLHLERPLSTSHFTEEYDHFEDSHTKDQGEHTKSYHPDGIMHNENSINNLVDSPALVPDSQRGNPDRRDRDEVEEERHENHQIEEHDLEHELMHELNQEEHGIHSQRFHDMPQDTSDIFNKNKSSISSSDVINNAIIPGLSLPHSKQPHKRYKPDLNDHHFQKMLSREISQIAQSMSKATQPQLSAAAGGSYNPFIDSGDSPADQNPPTKKDPVDKGRHMKELREREGDVQTDLIGNPTGDNSGLGPSNFMPHPPPSGTASWKEFHQARNVIHPEKHESELGPSNNMPLPPPSTMLDDENVPAYHTDLVAPQTRDSFAKGGKQIATPPPLIHKPGIITHVIKVKDEAHKKDHLVHGLHPSNMSHAQSNNVVNSTIKRPNNTKEDSLKSNVNESILGDPIVPTLSVSTDVNGTRVKPDQSFTSTNSIQPLPRNDSEETTFNDINSSDSPVIVSTHASSLNTTSNWNESVIPQLTRGSLSNQTDAEIGNDVINADRSELIITDIPPTSANNTNTTAEEPSASLSNSTDTTIVYNPCRDNDVVLQYLTSCRPYFMEIMRAQNNKAKCMHLLNGIMCLTDNIYANYHQHCTDTDVNHVIELNADSIQQFFPDFDPKQCLS
ncbi:uncharacterized protein LOC126815847 isoform X2 [Patella vulgata]|uniref:uncharacterized protein LOC126815847 isoform X2 n=1 Tax=Patella vulgata TaxID=6465 RepID=UPI00217FD0E3|nr:uncharacterized protein LOC126815847 isoform X2 [Patella vulgata]